MTDTTPVVPVAPQPSAWARALTPNFIRAILLILASGAGVGGAGYGLGGLDAASPPVIEQDATALQQLQATREIVLVNSKRLEVLELMAVENKAEHKEIRIDVKEILKEVREIKK